MGLPDSRAMAHAISAITGDNATSVPALTTKSRERDALLLFRTTLGNLGEATLCFAIEDLAVDVQDFEPRAAHVEHPASQFSAPKRQDPRLVAIPEHEQHGLGQFFGTPWWDSGASFAISD